jgi:Skp family chaperone for outer membrane proteins
VGIATANNAYLKRFIALLIGLVLCATQSVAQSDFPIVFPQPILVLDQDRLFNNSMLGQAMLLIQAEQRTVRLQESSVISDALLIEEKRLTDIRSEISPEEFSILSEDFDKRVLATRESQLAKDVEMQQSLDGQLRRFLVIAAPFLSEIMVKYQASAIVDQRSVLLFNRNMDITQEAIEILDRAFDKNPDLAIEKE